MGRIQSRWVPATIIAGLATMLACQPAAAGTAKGISELMLTARFQGNASLLAVTNLPDGQASKQGYGVHEETAGELVSNVEGLFRLQIAASALAVSPPNSQSVASFTESAADVFFIFNDPTLNLGDQQITITFATTTSHYAFAYGGRGKANAATNYSLTGFGSHSALPAMSLGPPTSFLIKFPSTSGLNHAEEFSRTFMLSPGDSYNVNLGGATVAAGAYTQTAVPEAATWAMMIAGFALVGLANRAATVSKRGRQLPGSPPLSSVRKGRRLVYQQTTTSTVATSDFAP